MQKNTVIFLTAIIILIISLLFLHFILSETYISKFYLNKDLKKGFFLFIYFAIKNLMFTYKILFIFPVIFILLSSFTIYYFLINIKKPIIELTHAVRKVSDGDFTTKIPVGKMNDYSTLYKNFNQMVKICRKKIEMQKYVSKSTAKMIDDLRTGEHCLLPKNVDITILFSDVRGFTIYSKKHDVLDVFKKINEIFNSQINIIEKNKGEIDKFMGDEIMAVFPSPKDALKAAIQIQKKFLSSFKMKKESLKVGIGINYGKAVIGAVGSGSSYDWTTIGDTVNVAKKICNYAEGGSIYISEDAYKKAKTYRKCDVRNVMIKGIEKKFKVYILRY